MDPRRRLRLHIYKSEISFRTYFVHLIQCGWRAVWAQWINSYNKYLTITYLFGMSQELESA